jgi:hypothetical protein
MIVKFIFLCKTFANKIIGIVVVQYSDGENIYFILKYFKGGVQIWRAGHNFCCPLKGPLSVGSVDSWNNAYYSFVKCQLNGRMPIL